MTDSLPTGFDTLLEIRTANITAVIKTKGKRTAVFAKNDEQSSLIVRAHDVEHIFVPEQNIYEDFRDVEGNTFRKYSVVPLFFEQTDYIVIIKSRNNEQLEFHSNSRLIENRVNRICSDDPSILSGVINFGNNIGFSDFSVMVNGKEVLFVRLEVYPTKISYKEDYRAMMSDINDLVSESVLDFLKKTYQELVPNHKRNNAPAVFFTVLQSVYKKYLQAVKRIISAPHHKLISEHDVLPYYKVRRIDIQTEKWLCSHPAFLKKTGNTILADRVLSVKKRITYDTQENRLVKFILQSTIRRIRDFSKRYLTTNNVNQSIIENTQKMEKELQRFLSSSFLADVSDYTATPSMSLVFRMAPGYRELYKYYIVLQCGISVGGDVFRMSIRETSQLYEYWCFIKLYLILRKRYELKSPDIIKVNRNGITIDLAKGRESRISFLNTKTGELFYLSYNPSETATQTVNQKPDNVLELEKKGSRTSYKYVFDAKYRVEMNPGGSNYPDNKPGPKVDDINTMHRYRDSIVFENPNSRFAFEKTMFGAYILFPYTNEDEYRAHKFFRSIENVNIGGLPFLPSATTLVTQLLDSLITDSSESAFERASLPVGIEDRLKVVDWNKRDVLIGLVTDEEHLRIFLGNSLYFTRIFDDKKNLPIRYVALYEKGSGIRYYGEVVSWYKERRSVLPGISAHSKEDYHVFKVLRWVELSDSIGVEETGPNPVAYTNFFLLSNAKRYSELRLRNEADYRFFIELKRRTETRVVDDHGATAFETGDSRVLIKDDIIYVWKGDVLAGRCAVSEFTKKPNATFRRLQIYMGDRM